MKRKNLRMRLASLAVFLLIGVMGVTGVASSYLGNTASNPVIPTNSAITASTNSDFDLSAVINKDIVIESATKVADNETLGLIIELEGETLIDKYVADPKGYASFQEYRLSKEGKAAAQALINKQNAVYNKIAREVDVELKYNYVNATNGFAIDFTYGDRDLITKIAKKANVVSTQISERYLQPETTVVTNEVAAHETGIFDSAYAIEQGIAGQGQVVAVLDTGLDWEHPAFQPDHELFDLENNTLKFTKETVAEVLDDLSASKTFIENLTVNEVYRNEKVPYVFDYADYDPEVNTHVENSHGTHVAGIVAGHSDDPYQDKNQNGEFDRDATGEDDEHYYDDKGEVITGITGVAPMAQLAIFKVFPDGTGGAESYAMLGAVEDCITLGVDVINMSLGGDCGFQNEKYGKDSVFHVYEQLEKVGISLVVAAGNSYSASYSSHAGLNLTSNPDSGIVSTPGSYDVAFTVASISGEKSPYMLAVDGAGNEYGAAYFLDSTNMAGEPYDFLEDIVAEVEKRGLTNTYTTEDGSLRIPYVTVSGVGEPTDYVGKNVNNKIALVSRGEINFEDKVTNAYIQGALACVVFNNAAGIIRMQVGDTPTIPSCSITMDAAFNIKGKDSDGAAYFVINENLEAGPFISEFSSWGPLPNLLLKPDITAHGGEIYSAIPGDETAYSRLSGTSMACPNTAGVVALLRQYFMQEENAEKFDLMSGNNVDMNLVEQRVYQVLQSTATIANNEDGNPYSPRKQGAGLADLNSSLKTEQYIYVMKDGKEQERTKIELFDDPEKTGEYELEFYVKNVGAEAQTYNVDAFVMTEGVSSDGKTVNEKAHMLEAPTRTLKVNGQAVEGTEVTVAANSTAKITYTFVLGDSDRAWLTKFENGMYVEGYATLTNTDEEGISLNVPYLAFYGDWADAPMMDYDQYEVSKDANDDTIDDDDKRYSNNRALMLIGKIVENNVEYSMPMGQFPFFIPEEFEALTPDTSEEYCALSYDNDTGMYGLFCAAGFLRNAKKLFWQLTDAVSGDIIMEGAYGDARKALAAGSTGGAWVELDLGLDIELVNNRKYNFAIYPVLDWNAEQFYVYDASQYHERFNSEGLDVQASIQKVIEYNEAYNAAHPDKARRYTWDSDFWVDTDAPIISDTEVRIERDKRDNATYYIDFYFTDNHYLSAMGFDYYNKDAKDFETLFSEVGMRPIISERNSTTLVSFNITDLWEQINEGIMYRNTHNAAEVEANPELGEYLTQLQIQVFDYAFNTSFYEIDLYDLLVPASSLAFGDIGTYTEYKSGDETVRVMTAYGDTVKEDANGNKLTMNQITLVPGQKVELMKAVSPFIGGTWREDLMFSTNVGGNVLRVDEETGEIYVPASIESQSPVSATVTVRSRANSSVYASLTVNILTNEEVDKFNINTGRLQAPSTITSLGFEDVMYKEFNAGESYVVEIKPDPWYVDFDTEKYFIQWSTGSDLIATVRATTPADGADYSPLKAIVTANNGYYYNDANGNNKHDSGEEVCEVGQGAYAANLSGTIDIVATLCQYADNGKNETADGKKYNTTFYTATFYAGVKEEFVLEGNQLTEYNGTPVSYTVDGKTYDKTVIIPSNLKIKTIKDNLFYRREDINAVVLNEGLETVGYASFAYMINLEYVKLPSTINKISDYGFAAYNPTTETNPQTKLTIVDTTACAKPLQVGQLGFALQRYIGVDLDASNIVDYDNPSAFGNNIVLYEENKFDMSKFRNVDNYALYETGHFLRTIDLSNLRMSGEAAFYGIGSGLPKFIRENGQPVYAEAIFGKNTILGDAALAGSGIGKVNLPMQRITYQAFFGNTSTTGEGDDASSEFINDGTLKEIEISGENVIIEEGAFLYSSVQKLVISGSIEYMGDAAFAYCENLSEIEYKDGATVKEIGHQAFYNCSSLREFTLPAGLTVLGNGSLAESKNLKTINIAAGCNLGELGVNNLDEIVSSPFYGCTNLEEFTVEAGNTTYYAENGVLYNADKTELIMVACKKSFADGELNQLLSGVTRIGNFAFSSNASVTSVDLSGITDLGIGAFFDCTNLTEVQFSDDLEVIPAASFYNCTSLRNARLSSNSKLETVGEFAFYETAITSINLPAMLRTIEPAAFAYTDLTSFTVPTRVTAIADDTFYECRSLSTVNFHNNVNSIGVRAFAYSAIREVSAANCRTVGEAAFASCSNLTTVNLPQVRRIDTYAFMAEVSSGADGSAVSRGGITNLTLTNVTSIGGYAFYYQTKLSVLTFNSLTSIGEYAFFGCSTLEQMQLPKIETIGQNAFSTSSIFAVYPSTAQGKGYAAVLPTTLVDIDPTAFADTMIGEYSINNDRYMTDNGVLYRILPEGGYELVSYPCYKQESMEYTIMDGTVRIAEYAFCFTEYLYRVNIPACVQSIGDSAFYGTSVRIFNFDTLVAPILEASHQTMTTESGDVYFWQVYNNFYLPFSFSNGEYSGFKYNPIRFKTEEEDAATVIDPVSGTEMQIQNTAYTAEDIAAGMSHYWYGITICRPSNAKGFDDLIWGNYFDSVLLTPELLEDATVTVMDLIRALPNADSITEANRAQVERARNRFEALGSDQQRAFIRAEGLVDVLVAAETKLATVAAENNTAVNNVITLIAALPAESALTLENKAAVEAARAAYNALSAENKATLDANVIAMQKLTQSEAKIAKLEAGEGEGTEDDGEGDTDASDCGTVAPLSGGSNGGNGLMVGLAAAVAIALVAVFSRKKQRN